MTILIAYIIYCIMVFNITRPILVDDASWATVAGLRGTWEAFRQHFPPSLTAYIMYRVSIDEPLTDEECVELSSILI